MISKRVLFIALALIAVSATSAMAAVVNVDDFVVGTLSIDPTSTLDVAEYGIATVTPYSQILNYVAAGNIISTKANTDPSTVQILAICTGQDFMDLISSTLDGHTVLATDTLLVRRYWGDINMDGQVNGDDYSLMDIGVNIGTASWPWGDVDGNGVVNADDYSLADIAINGQGPRMSNLNSGIPTAAGATLAPSAPVPEPSTLVLLFGTALAGFVAYLRKR